MATKKSINKIALMKTVEQIQKQKNIISKARDAMRLIYDDLEDIIESSDRGVDSIQDGIDALSEYL